MDCSSHQETTTASSSQVVANSTTFKNHSRPVQVQQQERIQDKMQSLAQRGNDTASSHLNQAEERLNRVLITPYGETNPRATAQLVTGCTKITACYLPPTIPVELNIELAMNRPAVQERNPAATGVMTFVNMDLRIDR